MSLNSCIFFWCLLQFRSRTVLRPVKLEFISCWSSFLTVLPCETKVYVDLKFLSLVFPDFANASLTCNKLLSIEFKLSTFTFFLIPGKSFDISSHFEIYFRNIRNHYESIRKTICMSFHQNGQK